MNGIKRYSILCLAIIFAACSVSRHVPQGESLYVGGSVKVVPDSLARRQVSGLESKLEDLLRPAPNSTLFGFPHKVWLYYLMGEPKREKGFKSWFRRKFGEPPMLTSQRMVTVNNEVIAGNLNNEGYFRSTATGELKEGKNRTAKAYYTAFVRPRYFINDVKVQLKDSTTQFGKDLLSAFRDNPLLKKSAPYRLQVIQAERQRIDLYLKAKGYYYFNPDYLLIKVDSTIGDHKVNLFLEVKAGTAQTALKQYRIKDIYVYSNYQGLAPDTVASEARIWNGLHIVDRGRLYRPRIFDDAVGFKPGDLYSNEIHDISLSRLINLRNFKFVKNRFDLIPRSDSALLDVHYYLTPVRKKSLRVELSGITKSNNTAGMQANLGWNNVNTFKGAEILRIGVLGGFDFQLGGAANSSLGTNYIRFRPELQLTFPRILLPFYKYHPEDTESLPLTTLTVAYERLIQRGFYTLTSISGQWGYTWRPNSEVEHTLAPFGVNLVRPTNITNAFVQKIFESGSVYDLLRYYEILNNRLILESQYTITYRPKPGLFSKNQLFMSGGINLAGNLAGLFVKKKIDGEVSKELFNIPYEQFARFDAEVRFYHDLTPSIKWANRFIGGLGIPYGNSINMPLQIKQYFSGGSTSIRAFPARSLGPGAYHADSASRALFGNNSFGDIKLELNTELRFKFTNLIHGAAFVDAGNVWNYRFNEKSLYGEEAVFKKDFYKQLAVGGGLGLRFDFTYLIFRLDLATPFRKPWYTVLEQPKNPWVFNEINLGSKAWRKENLVLNIAVAYPF